MTYQLIADAGSSKTDWALIDAGGNVTSRFSTGGLNAMLADEAALMELMKEVSRNLPEGFGDADIHYYGAGCATPEICSATASAFDRHFSDCRTEVSSDLIGAARSLLGREGGIACILGTGSNSCAYDGEKITEHIPSLGFILGDEGSGAALGKKLVADAFKGRLPAPIKEIFLDRYKLTEGDILERIYRRPAPNKFLASLVPFIKEHIWNPYVYALVRKEFELFFERNVSPYSESRSVPVSFTGSVAFHFSDILRETAEDNGCRIGSITSRPLDGLIRYHSELKK